MDKIFISSSSKLCSTKELFDKQVGKIKQFMSSNGYPKTFVNYLIKDYDTNPAMIIRTKITMQADNENIPKIWIRLPYL